MRRAMAELGLAPRAVPMGPDRAPVWPSGLVGSLSHIETAALAVLAPLGRAAALGVDIELATPLPENLFDTVLTRGERAASAGCGLVAKRVFCAKEALYKAQYPLTGQVLDFDAVVVTLGARRFSARFRQGAGRFGAGARLDGWLAEGAGCILAGVLIVSS
jgi:4'-phosphopantetheinyl transferase EntD